MGDLELLMTEIGKLRVELNTGLAEVRRQVEPIPAIEEHLRTLNGRVGKNEGRIDKLEKATSDAVTTALVNAARLEERWRPVKVVVQIGRFAARDGFVLKAGM